MAVRRTVAPIPILLSLALVGVMIGACATSGAEPRAVATGPRLTQDAELLEQIEPAFADDFDRAAVAVVDGEDVRAAFVDADATTVFEIGSITKALTGQLLAIGIERGEVALDDPLGAHLDLGAAPVASVTLRQLATHHGGIPSYPTDPAWMAEFERAMAANEEPPDADLEDLLTLARETEVLPDAPFRYSNLGSALLGHALASAAGTTYSDLLADRLLEPLDMDGADVVETDDQVPLSHAGGFTETGEPVEPWSVGAFSPAGGVHATLPDLVALALAVLDGELADSAALDPVADTDVPVRRIGYQWFTVEEGARTLTMHEGQTGGFASSLLIDRRAGTAAVVLSNSIGDRYPLALVLLATADG